jgi:hypothetical protein
VAKDLRGFLKELQSEELIKYSALSEKSIPTSR